MYFRTLCRYTNAVIIIIVVNLRKTLNRLYSAKLLRVTFFHNLKFDEHVKNILIFCNQRCYLFKCLKGQGLFSKELHTVFRALTVSRILYALPAWGSFLTADLIGKIDAYLCVKPSDWAIMAILNCCLNFFMMQIL